MALDAKLYVVEVPTRTVSKMPEPPNAGNIAADRWRRYADELDAYLVAYAVYVDALKAYAKDQADLLDKYRDDLLTAHGLSEHPKALDLFEIALQSAVASSGGLAAIEKTVAKLAPLLK